MSLSKEKQSNERSCSYGSIPPNDEERTAKETAVKDDSTAGSRTRDFGSWAWIAIATAAVVLPALVYTGSRDQFPNMRSQLLELSSTESTSSSSSSESPTIPFPMVDRSEYSSTPASDIVDPELFAPSLRSSTGSSGLLNVPFPTGAFWTNLVLVKSTSDQGLSYPVMAYPYAYKWSPNVLQVSYPPLRRLMDNISVRDIFNPDLTMSVVEDTTTRQVTAFDPLSVTLRFSTSSSSSSYWETYLVQGSPYVTVAFEQTTPIVRALSIFTHFGCVGGDNDNTHCTTVENSRTSVQLKGTRFQITTQENLTWLLVASDPLTLEYDALRKTTITATEAYQGVLRLVLLPPNRDYIQPESLKLPFPSKYTDIDNDDSSVTSAVSQLLCHSRTYPVGGRIAWDHDHNQKNVATVEFRYQTKTMNNTSQDCGDSQELLMLALPHHVQVLPQKTIVPKSDFGLAFRTIKGAMVPVLGNTWKYEEPLTTIGFESEETLRNAQNLEAGVRSAILEQVQKDKSRVLPTLDENVYGFGKQVARLAQLAHIASVLEEESDGDSDDTESLTTTICGSLYQFLSSYLTGKMEDKLVYDTAFGGIVSVNGLKDFMDDFGNGWYNDHLFHYGYIMYAAAVLGKLNSTFVEEFGDAVDALFLDVANPVDPQQSSSGPHDLFPFTRHKSWFDSHSFASGLFPFADGKSMESSGESVNFYYGAYLWTTVRRASNNGNSKNAELAVDWARLLLAMELRGVKTYWHMVAQEDDMDPYHATDIYNPQFAKTLMVGNVGMMDVTIATWFGIEPLYVHMINFLPVTAITKELFDQTYAQEEFQTILAPVYDTVEMAWKGYVVSDRALTNPTAAYQDAWKLRSYELDQAISQSQVLYFASTMDGFVAPENSDAGDSTSDNSSSGNSGSSSNSDGSSAAACDQNSACADLGLMGYCCPAANGVFLGCCDNSGNDSSSSNGGTDNQSSSAGDSGSNSASCQANQACADLGLTGLCCPAGNGVTLGCCS